jgi:hypothetical protein
MMGGAVYPGLCWDGLRGHVEGMVIEFLNVLSYSGWLNSNAPSYFFCWINVFLTHTYVTCNLVFSEIIHPVDLLN